VNIFLWILQVLLGLAFVAAGYNHGFNIQNARTLILFVLAAFVAYGRFVLEPF